MAHCGVGIGRYVDQSNPSETKSSEELGRIFLPNVPQLRTGQGSKLGVLKGSKETVRHLAGYVTLWD